MSRPHPPPPPEPRTINANPANNTANATSAWFIDKPNPAEDKFGVRPGNNIELLNCGGAYLGTLVAEIASAKDSIYIAIWGFYEELPLSVIGGGGTISRLLEKKARNGVEVKIMVWGNPIAITGSAEPTLPTPRPWTVRAAKGLIPNLQFVTRDLSEGFFPTASASHQNTPEGQEQLARRKAELAWLEKVPKDATIYARMASLEEEINRLQQAGEAANTLYKKRAEKKYPLDEIGKFPTHHQKAILIDHRLPRANGFVQGFNFLPSYFDVADHDFREGGNHYQDVGLHLKGPCLIDLFHNFKEGWNLAIKKPQFLQKEEADKNESWVRKNVSDPILDKFDIDSVRPGSVVADYFSQQHGVLHEPTEITEKAPMISAASGTKHDAQILRTWPTTGETQILKFIRNAITKLNNFIYIEDQYFRMPEFADALIAQAADLKKRSGNQKMLYVFAVISLNENAVGEIRQRQNFAKLLGRDDTDATEEQFNERQKQRAQNFTDNTWYNKMKGQGVMVHICQLANAGKGSNHTIYQNIYVHSKLSIYDNAFLLLGSANWNLRSMTSDSELDIAVECHDDLATRFRAQL